MKPVKPTKPLLTREQGILWTNINSVKMVNLKEFMPSVPVNIKSFDWTCDNYFYEPSSKEVYSIATGVLKVMLGTTDPTLKSRTFVKNFGKLDRMHESQIFNFHGFTYTRQQIRNYFERHYNKHNPGVNATQAELFVNPLPKAAPQLLKPHPSHGKVEKGNGIIGRVKKVGELETIEFSANPKIHTSQDSWSKEMERLARAYPGEKFVVVIIGSSVVLADINWS